MGQGNYGRLIKMTQCDLWKKSSEQRGSRLNGASEFRSLFSYGHLGTVAETR